MYVYSSTVKIITPFSGLHSPRLLNSSQANTWYIYFFIGRAEEYAIYSETQEEEERAEWDEKISDLINFCFNLFWSFLWWIFSFL